MSVKGNVIANYIGRGWCALASFLFIPLYIHYLGIEAYGIIGFFSSLMAALSFLDFGMGQTLARETARSSEAEFDRKELTVLIGTLEYIYWVVGAMFAFVIWHLSDWLASDWLSAVIVGYQELVTAIQIMGMVTAIRWASGPYRSVLIGRQAQVWLNSFEAFFATLRGLGVVLVLAWVSDSILAFFVFQGLVSLLEVILLRWKVWHMISNHGFSLPRFDMTRLKRIWKFSGGVATITLFGTGISQMDKLLLPGLVSLEVFGYYMVAHALGRSIAQLSFPVATAFRPLFAKLVADEQYQELSRQYHKASQVMAVSIIPITLVVAVFSEHILWVWTGNPEVVSGSALLVSLIAIGTMFNGLVNIPYSIQLAYGYLKLGLLVNFVSAIILIPAFYIGVKQYGVIAAGWVWLILNMSYVLINLSIMHRRYLINEASAWYGKDVLPVLTSASAVVFSIHYFASSLDSKWSIMIVVTLAIIASIFSACMAADKVRRYTIDKLSILIKRVYS